MYNGVPMVTTQRPNILIQLEMAMQLHPILPHV